MHALSVAARRARRGARSHRALGLAAAVGALSCGSPDFWILESRDCTLQHDVTLAGARGPWTGCRAVYDARVNELSLQLITATEGNFVLSGPGWLTLRLAPSTPSGATLRARFTSAAVGTDSAARIPPVGEVYAIHSNPTDRLYGQRYDDATGSIRVGSLAFGADPATLRVSCSVEGLVLGGIPLAGTFAIRATPPPPSTPGTPPGGGGTSGSCSAACPNRCSTNPPQQACYYCLAACVCRCSGDAACAQRNAAQAAALGTTC